MKSTSPHFVTEEYTAPQLSVVPLELGVSLCQASDNVPGRNPNYDPFDF